MFDSHSQADAERAQQQGEHDRVPDHELRAQGSHTQPGKHRGHRLQHYVPAPTRSVYPQPRNVWISFTSCPASTFFRSIVMYTSTILLNESSSIQIRS